MGTTRSKYAALDAIAAERLRTRLRQARQMRNETLKKVADAAGCSESMLSRIEGGQAYPSIVTLIRLVNVLQISMGWLFDDRDDEGSPERPLH